MMYLLLWSLFTGCGGSSQVEDSPPSDLSLLPHVRTEVATNMIFSDVLEVPASLQGVRSAVLIPKSFGRVAEVHVRIGDRVKKGQLLISIDPSDYEQGVMEASATYRLASAQSTQANVTYKRFLALFEQSVVTKSQFEEVEVGLKLAKEQKNRAKVGLKIAEQRLADAKLVAPFDGVIVARNIETGELLGGAIQQPPLMIADLSRVVAVGAISETSVANIKIGQVIDVKVPAFRGQKFSAKIEKINGAVDPILRTVQVEATIDNGNGLLKHGMSSELVIYGQDEEHIGISRTALMNRNNGGATVFVLDDGRVISREVSYERSNSNLVPILDGISEGDVVLTSGHTRLREGDQVIRVSE